MAVKHPRILSPLALTSVAVAYSRLEPDFQTKDDNILRETNCQLYRRLDLVYVGLGRV